MTGPRTRRGPAAATTSEPTASDPPDWAAAAYRLDRPLPPVPSTPAPGPLDVAASLLVHRCERRLRYAHRLLNCLGLRDLPGAPGPPATIRDAAARYRVVPARVSMHLTALRQLAADTGVPASATAAQLLLTRGPARTEGEAIAELLDAGLVTAPVPLLGVRRMLSVWRAPSASQGWRLEAGLLVPEAVRAGWAKPPPGVPAARHALRAAVRSAGILDVTEGAAGFTAAAAALLADTDPALRRHQTLVWAARPGSGEALPRVLARALALGPLPLDELLDAAATGLRYSRGQRPPLAIESLHAYLASQPQVYRFEAARDRKADRQAPRGRGSAWVALRRGGRRHLTAADKALLRAVTAAGGTASYADLCAALVEAGYSEKSGYPTIAACPLLKRMSRGRYALRSPS